MLEYLLRDGLAYVFAVVLVNLEHVQEDGAQLGDVHGPQRPAHPRIRLEDLGDLARLDWTQKVKRERWRHRERRQKIFIFVLATAVTKVVSISNAPHT